MRYLPPNSQLPCPKHTLEVPLSASAAPTRPVTGEGIYCVSLLTLSRKKGIQSNPALGLSSAHCPACAAPETDSSHDSCDFCGRVLNDGTADWLLTAMDSENSPAAKSLLSQLAHLNSNPNTALQPTPKPWPADSMGMLIWLARIIVADGFVTDREQQLFSAFGYRHQLTFPQLQAILDTARRERK